MNDVNIYKVSSGLAGAALLLLSLSSNAASVSATTVDYSGYIKIDGIFSKYSDGSLSAQNLGRDFYIPGLTPVGGAESSSQFDAHAKQTRFRLTTKTDDGDGQNITGVIELDFIVTPGGNERVSNSYVPRIRHGFIMYKGWTVGQTWTTFQDVKTLPETLDFIGITDGVTFNRQVVVRYQTGPWEFALENPESTITPFENDGPRIVSDNNNRPDAVVRYTYNGTWGHLSIAGLIRQLKGVSDQSVSSAGISLNSKIKMGKSDDLRLSFTAGSGLGRYLALNTANGAVLDAEGKLEAIDSSGFALAYRKVWNPKLRSTLSYSRFSADNDNLLTGSLVTKSTNSMRVNLLYSPTPKITVGGELARGSRELESGVDGSFTRIQMSMKYVF